MSAEKKIQRLGDRKGEPARNVAKIIYRIECSQNAEREKGGSAGISAPNYLAIKALKQLAPQH